MNVQKWKFGEGHGVKLKKDFLIETIHLYIKVASLLIDRNYVLEDLSLNNNSHHYASTLQTASQVVVILVDYDVYGIANRWDIVVEIISRCLINA